MLSTSQVGIEEQYGPVQTGLSTAYTSFEAFDAESPMCCERKIMPDRLNVFSAFPSRHRPRTKHSIELTNTRNLVFQQLSVQGSVSMLCKQGLVGGSAVYAAWLHRLMRLDVALISARS